MQRSRPSSATSRSDQRPGPARVAVTEHRRQFDVQSVRGRGGARHQITNDPDGTCPALLKGVGHRRQPHRSRVRIVIEADDRDIVRHASSGGVQRRYDTECDQVAISEHRGRMPGAVGGPQGLHRLDPRPLGAADRHFDHVVQAHDGTEAVHSALARGVLQEGDLGFADESHPFVPPPSEPRADHLPSREVVHPDAGKPCVPGVHQYCRHARDDAVDRLLVDRHTHHDEPVDVSSDGEGLQEWGA